MNVPVFVTGADSVFVLASYVTSCHVIEHVFEPVFSTPRIDLTRRVDAFTVFIYAAVIAVTLASALHLFRVILMPPHFLMTGVKVTVFASAPAAVTSGAVLFTFVHAVTIKTHPFVIFAK